MKTIVLGIFILFVPFLFCQTPLVVPVPPQDMTPALSLLQALDLAEAELTVKAIDVHGYPLCSAVWEDIVDRRRWHFRWSWQALDPMLTQSLSEEGFIDALVDSKGVVTLAGPLIEGRSSGAPWPQTDPALPLREALNRADNYFKGKNYVSNYLFLSSMCFKIQDGIGTWQLSWSTKVMADSRPLILNVAMDGSVYEPGSIRLSPQDLQDLPKQRDLQTTERIETLWPLVRCGPYRFKRFDLDFTVVLDGFSEMFVMDGPYLGEDRDAILGTLVTFKKNPLAAVDGQKETIPDLDLTVIVKKPPAPWRRFSHDMGLFIRFLCEGEPITRNSETSALNRSFYRQLSKENRLTKVPWSRDELKGTFLCYSQDQYSYQAQEPKKTLTDTVWHVDFISLVNECALLLKFSAPFPPGTPLPKELLARIEAILTTLHLRPKGRASYPRHKQWPDQTGRLVVIVAPNGRCTILHEAALVPTAI